MEALNSNKTFYFLNFFWNENKSTQLINVYKETTNTICKDAS